MVAKSFACNNDAALTEPTAKVNIAQINAAAKLLRNPWFCLKSKYSSVTQGLGCIFKSELQNVIRNNAALFYRNYDI